MNATLEKQTSHIASGEHAEVLTQIYQPDINIAVLKRKLSTPITNYVASLAEARPQFALRSVINAESATEQLAQLLPELTHQAAFVEDLSLLAEMYAYLFELEEVGLRLAVVHRAMCPRFHIDKLGCRLVTSYHGAGTEWLANDKVDRAKLGHGSQGMPDDSSGLYQNEADIQKAQAGDVLLLKGEGWFENEGKGIVHRSPTVAHGEWRLLVTMDFA